MSLYKSKGNEELWNGMSVRTTPRFISTLVRNLRTRVSLVLCRKLNSNSNFLAECGKCGVSFSFDTTEKAVYWSKVQEFGRLRHTKENPDKYPTYVTRRAILFGNCPQRLPRNRWIGK